MSFTKKVVTTYAKSLFQNVRNSESLSNTTESFDFTKITSPNSNKKLIADVFVIGEELLLLRAILISSKKLNSFFQNPTYSENQKLEILLTIFPGLTITMKSFLKVLTERTHLSLIPEITDEFTKLLLKFKNSTLVKLIVASSLKEQSGLSLLNTLKDVTNSTEIILNVSYNPKLLGGLILEYKSTSIDASILKEFSLFFNEV